MSMADALDSLPGQLPQRLRRPSFVGCFNGKWEYGLARVVQAGTMPFFCPGSSVG